MNFLSLKFLIYFFVLILLLRHTKNQKNQKGILLAASYVFYAFGSVRFLALLVLVSILMWFLGRKIEDTSSKNYLILGVAIDLTVLGIFKYANFFMEGFAKVFGVNSITLQIILPIGISFYTFQAISYIADIYTGKMKSQSFLNVLLYIGFFPQIVSGPIVKAHDFMQQIEKDHSATADRIMWGIQKFALGAFKKAVIADRLCVCVDSVYAAPSAYSGLSLLMAVVSYALQIYYDFSGYSDMAIAVAHILGFDYERNFNMPYLAKNPSDFWKRWHISLSSWFRDYVYIPLGGNRKGKTRTYINVFITMLLSGLWHGSSWAYVIWGFLHATASVVHKAFCDIFPQNKSKSNIIKDAFCTIINFIIVTVLWIPFRLTSVSQTLLILKRIFTWSRGIKYYFVYTIVFAILLIIVECISALKNNKNDVWRALDLKKFWPKVVFCIFLLLTVMFAYIGNGAFIYSQF